MGPGRRRIERELQAARAAEQAKRRAEHELASEFAKRIVEDTLAQSSEEEKADYGVIKEKIRADLKRYISKRTQKRPLIMPVILEI